MKLGLVIVLALAFVASEANRRDHSQVDKALRLQKGDINEIEHGPVYKPKKYGKAPTKKQLKKRLLGHQGEHWASKDAKTTFKPRHDFDDIRLQDLEYEPVKETKTVFKDEIKPRKFKKTQKPKAKKASKKAEKKALKKEMRKALQKGLSPKKVYQQCGKGSKYPKKFYKKFLKKYKKADKAKKRVQVIEKP